MAERPTDTACLECGKVFVQPQRVQGGGRHSIYCSPACRSMNWVKGNRGKRTATILKYEASPDFKAKKKQWQKRNRVAKYGWTFEQFQKQLHRQNHQCYGCTEAIDEETACIDHCHETNRVRGLLCKFCNWGLGHIRNNPMTLRRLWAYLDYKIEQPCVYLAGALKNPRIPEIGNKLRAIGCDVMDEWWTPGEHADTNWQLYEKIRGRSFQEALQGRSARNTVVFDRAFIDISDIFINVAPSGKSAMLEMGYAKARGKHTILFLDGHQPERYDVMPALVDAVITTEIRLIEEVRTCRSLSNGCSQRSS
jgi:nucleoside 2-deoxyribosyltransferase